MLLAAILLFGSIYALGLIASFSLLVIEAKRVTIDAVIFAITWPLQVFLIIPLAWLLKLDFKSKDLLQ